MSGDAMEGYRSPARSGDSEFKMGHGRNEDRANLSPRDEREYPGDSHTWEEEGQHHHATRNDSGNDHVGSSGGTGIPGSPGGGVEPGAMSEANSHGKRRRNSRDFDDSELIERSHRGSGGDYSSRPLDDSEEAASSSLLVRHIKFSTPPLVVRRFFEQCGEVKDVYLPLEYETGRPRGFGFVEFAHARDAQEALRVLNETELEGSRISISVAQHGRKTPSIMRARSGYRRVRGSGHRREPYSAPDRYGGRSSSPRAGGYRGYEDRREYRDSGSYGRREQGREGYEGSDSYYRERGGERSERGGRYEEDRDYRDGGSSFREGGGSYRDGAYRDSHRDYDRRRY